MAITLKPYNTGDEEQILALFKECYNREMTLDYWKWRFLDNSVPGIFIWLAWDGNKAVAHYAVSPITLSIHNKEYLAALSLTTMTHPKYRGLKLFPQLANEVYRILTEMGYILVFGFPNRNSHRIFVNDLHWKDIYEIPTFQLGLSENNKLNNNCINSSHDLDELVIMDNNFELNYNITSSLEIPIQVKKNKTYLIWRYSRHPLNKYYNFAISNKGAASSFCVVKKYLNNLDIIDFQASNKDECEILINYIIRFAFLKKLDNINCWAPRHHFLHQLCEKYGFINREPITYFCCRHLANEKHEQFYDLYCNWYVQMGDSDVY